MHTWGVYSRVTYCLLITLTWLHNRHCLWTIALLGCSFHAIQFIDCDEPYGSFIIVFKVYHSLGPIFAYSSSCITITQFRTSLSALKETTLASSHTLSTSFPVLLLSYLCLVRQTENGQIYCLSSSRCLKRNRRGQSVGGSGGRDGSSLDYFMWIKSYNRHSFVTAPPPRSGLMISEFIYVIACFHTSFPFISWHQAEAQL